MLRFKRSYYRYSLKEGARAYPTRAWVATRGVLRSAVIIFIAAVVVCLGVSHSSLYDPHTASFTAVPGQNYEICNDTSELTSPWTYDALASGSQTYTVQQYEALSGYGTSLPPLPAYIAAEGPAATAAEVFAPGAAVSLPAYDFPNSPMVFYFEGGSYGPIGFDTVSGDEFMGGSAAGFPEPIFNDNAQAGGINGQNGSYDFSGGQGTLSATATAGATSFTTNEPINGYIYTANFADGTSYQIANVSGNTVTLQSALTQTETAGTNVWASRAAPVAFIASAAAQGATTVTLSASSIPFMQYANAVIGDDSDLVKSVTGTQAGGYTLTLNGGLDTAVVAGTPVYYTGNSGDVTVEYLNINDDQHLTTGTIYTGVGWTIEHDNIHDGNSNGPGYGVAIYGGDEGTVDYNCLSKMGDYGVNLFGTNSNFNYNEVYESNFKPDPGCGCSGAGKWWGTLNANIEDNAFIGDGIGGGGAIWLDNGNTGTTITGNYFDQTYGSAIASETGFDLNVSNNLFMDDNWGTGSGCGNTNCVGDIGINTSGGFNVPGSNYENEILISGNQFINDWGGVGIWESGARSCENSGEGWPNDAPYCSGGFPITNTTTAGNKYNFSHVTNDNYGGTVPLMADASSGSSTLRVQGNMAIDDQIGFDNAASTTTASTVNVTSFTGSGTLPVTSTTGFPSTGQLSVATSGGNAALSYTGTTGTSFTGVSLITDPDMATSGTLSGDVNVNNVPYAATTDTTSVASLSGSGTINASTLGFPSSGQLRVSTNEAWGDAGGSYTGAILSYTGTTGSSFTGVSLLRGAGTLNGSITAVPPYKVTGETCYINDCEVTVSPAIAATEITGTQISTAGTCQLYATAAATPTSPLAPNGTSYWDGCQWEARGVSITGNTFDVQPSLMDATPSVTGGTTSCTVAHYCGMMFMADQPGGEPPFDNQIGANAMMSSSTFTGCPVWQSSCGADPLMNLNGSNPPGGAPASNGEAPYNDVWSSNTYNGPWSWNTFIYGNCSGSFPTGMPSDYCSPTYSEWHNGWQQDNGTSENPLNVTLSGLTAGQEIHGPSQTVTAYQDTLSGATINSSLLVGTTTDSTASNLTSSAHAFTLNTLNYHDGQYNIKVSSTDSGGNSNSDSATVYIANGDLNGDGSVSLSDLAIMAAHWGQSDSNYSDGNITGQGTINLSDLAVLASNWGWANH